MFEPSDGSSTVHPLQVRSSNPEEEPKRHEFRILTLQTVIGQKFAISSLRNLGDASTQTS
jgi:hypothetical protein